PWDSPLGRGWPGRPGTGSRTAGFASFASLSGWSSRLDSAGVSRQYEAVSCGMQSSSASEAKMPAPVAPGPAGTLLGGSLREVRRDMLGFFLRIAREYGDVVSFRLGPRRLHLINHPDLIEEVLV